MDIVIGAARARAQATEISGAVSDQSGAILPGVEVMVTQTDTGIVVGGNDETGASTYPIFRSVLTGWKRRCRVPQFTCGLGIVLKVGSNLVLTFT